MGKPREAGTTYVSSRLDPHAQFKPVSPKLAEMECVAPRPGGPNGALQSVAPNISSTHRAPYRASTILLTTFPRLYYTSLGLL